VLTQYSVQKVPTLYNRIFPGDNTEELFLTTQVVPLLAQKDMVPAAARLAWSVSSILESKKAGHLLTQICVKNESSVQVIEEVLEAAGQNGKASESVKAWLTNSEMVELVINLVLEILKTLSDGEGVISNKRKAVKSVYATGLEFPSESLEKVVVAMITNLEKCDNGMDSSVAANYLEFVCEILKLMTFEDNIWKEKMGADLILKIFMVDNGSWNRTLQNKIESAWMKCCKQIGLESALVQRMVTSVQNVIRDDCSVLVFERCISKCESLLNLAGTQETGLRFILSLIPDWEKMEDFSNHALYKQVFTQRLWFSQPVFPSVMEDPDYKCVSAKPRVSLFLCKLLGNLLGLTEFADSCTDTVPDSERVELSEEVVAHLVEVVGSTCYLENACRQGWDDQSGLELGTKLPSMSSQLISRLGKETYKLLNLKIRGLSLRLGGLWSEAFGWLLRLQYQTSEWDMKLPSLLPRVDTWTDGELATALQVLQVAKVVNSGCGMLSQIASVESGRMLSLGGLCNPGTESLVWLIAECLSLASDSQVATLSEEVVAVLDTLLVFRADSEERLLYSRDISEITWSEANTVACIANLLSTVIARSPDILSTDLWDLASCSLVSWCSSLEESQANIITRPAVMLVAVAVCKLAAVMAALLGPQGHHPALSPPPESNKENNLPPKLREEWAEFFSEGIFSSLLPIFVSLSSADKNIMSTYLMAELGSTLVHCTVPLLLSIKLSPLYLVQDVDSAQLPDNITYLYNHIGPLLMSSCRHTQVTAAHILAAIAQATTEAEDPSGEEEEKEVPRRLLEVITKGNTILETLLSEFNVGETAGSIPPGNLTHTLTMGYLLAWRVVLCLIEQAGEELRPKYSEFLRSQGHLEQLLNHLFRLLPTSTSTLDSSFLKVPLDVSSDFSSLELQQLSGSCWVSVCRHLPALARQWWQGLDRTAKDMVEKVTCFTVTPMLWREEATAIAGAEASDNMTLKVRDSVREVVATYTIDEGSMELVVSLPSNHPLGGLTVESGRRVGVDTGQWRKWMLQLTTFLTHQNGTILDGLKLWKRNVDKRFEGVEECYICFYILHGSNHQLPKLACRTCKKKFHSACLYKWFSTSNNSSCPLCRNLF